MRQQSLLLVAAATLVCAAGSAVGRDQLGAIWDGGGESSAWWNPINWNNNMVPNNGVDTWWVLTHPGPVGNGVMIDIEAATTIDKMGIAGTDTVRLLNGHSFTVIGQTDNKGVTGLFGGAGTFSMEAVPNLTDFRIGGDPNAFLVVGNNQQFGLFHISNSQNNRVYGLAATNRLIVDENYTFRGAGQVGINQLRLTNFGIFDAVYPTPMTIDLAGADNLNYGTLQATNGGTLTLLNTTFSSDGTRGDVFAGDGSVVNISNCDLPNHDFSTSGTGVLRFTGNSTITNPVNFGTLSHNNGVGVVVQGPLLNHDTYDMLGGPNLTDVILNSPEIAFTGGGVMNLSDSINNRIYGVNALRRLVNAADHVIRGSGQIGINNLFNLTNDGIIRADQPTMLQIDLTAGDNFNNNLLEATNGAVLSIINSALDNTNGILHADDNSRIELTSVSLIAGEMTTTGSGEVRLIGNNVFVNPLINGLLTMNNGLSTDIHGTLTHTQSFNVNGGPSLTDIRLNTPEVTFTGGGVMNLSNSVNNRIYGINAPRRLINAADHTIRGAGQIGINNLFNITNDGIIQADQPSTMTIDLSEGENVNNNLIQAVDGAVLLLLNSPLTNNGVIHAGDDSLIQLSGMGLSGGTLTADGSGFYHMTGNNTVWDITLNARCDINNGLSQDLLNTVTNNGQINLNGSLSLTDIRINSPVTTINGDGELVLANSVNNRIYGINAVRRLVNGPEHTIRGAGQIGINNLFNLTNEGAIIADTSSGLQFDVTDDFTNHGLLHANTGDITIHPGAFLTDGTVLVDEGRVITRNGNYDQSGGETILHGALNIISGGAINLTGGVLKGIGSVTAAAVHNTGGRIEPGLSVGHLTLNGTLNQSGNGVIGIEVGGTIPFTGHDVLSVGGTANLGGTLEISFVGGYEPQPQTVYTVLVAGAIDGEFDDIVGPGTFSAIYRGQAVWIVYEGPLPDCAVADLNCDGAVGVADLLLLLAAWGTCADIEDCPADLTDDGSVGVADLLMLLQHWG